MKNGCFVKLCDVDFNEYEVADDKLYIKGFAQTTLSTRTLPFYIAYLDIALTKTEADGLVNSIYALPKLKEISVGTKYLSSETLEAYLADAYGEKLELFVCEDVRFCVSNIVGAITEELMQNQSLARWPGYLMRGKPVTPEQAMEIFIRSDLNTRTILDEEFRRADMNFSNYHVLGKYTGLVCAWIGFDGTVGIDGTTGKNPTMLEYMQELTQLAGWFPFLDLMIVVDPANEWCNDVAIQACIDNDPERPPEVAFIIKNGLVRLLDGENIGELFAEYYDKYDVNLKNGTPVTYYDNKTDYRMLPYSVYNADTHEKYFRPCGEDATDETVEAFLKKQNLILREKYNQKIF